MIAGGRCFDLLPLRADQVLKCPRGVEENCTCPEAGGEGRWDETSTEAIGFGAGGKWVCGGCGGYCVPCGRPERDAWPIGTKSTGGATIPCGEDADSIDGRSDGLGSDRERV